MACGVAGSDMASTRSVVKCCGALRRCFSRRAQAYQAIAAPPVVRSIARKKIAQSAPAA
jgi:hypothetical protein